MDRESHAWWRTAAACLAALAVLIAIGVLAWQIALANAPRYRASLEQIVRARTGLDVRFNEIGLAWGWYGPEAILREVELIEPGHVAPLLRAGELIAALDAWGSLQSGELKAGRITLVAADIDLSPRLGGARIAASKLAARGSAVHPGAELLTLWPRGRIDVEGGTLRLPDPADAMQAIDIRIGRATLRRTDRRFNAYVQAVLPERLGRSARAWLELSADPVHPENASGSLRVQVQALQLAGWGAMAMPVLPGWSHLPTAGSASLDVVLAMRAGQFAEAHGDLQADGVTMGATGRGTHAEPLWLGAVQAGWHLARAGDGWRFSAERLGVGPDARLQARTTLRLETDAAGTPLAGQLSDAPAAMLQLIAQALLPQLDWRSVPDLAGLPRLDARLSGAPGEWQAQLSQSPSPSGGAPDPALAAQLRLRWSGRPAGGAPHLSARVAGRIEPVLSWLAVPALRGIDAKGSASFEFDARLPARAGETLTQVRLLASVADGEVRLAPSVPPLKSVRGQLRFENGRLRRARLTSEWLGGPAMLRVSSRGAAAAPVVTVQARGVLEAQALVAAINTDLAAAPVSGRTPWRGELEFQMAGAQRAARWRAHAQTQFQGVLSSLPAPFGKGAAAAAPLRIDLAGSEQTASLRVAFGTQVRGAFELRARADGGWQASRGALHLGGGAAVLESDAGISITGHLARAEAPDWLFAWRELAASADGVPLHASLAIDSLDVGGASYPGAHLSARSDAQGAQLQFDGGEFKALAHWAHGDAPMQVELHGAGATGRATLACARPMDSCRAGFELTSEDSAATLAALGVRADVSAARGELRGELVWPARVVASPREWLAGVSGTLHLTVADGALEPHAADHRQPLSLLPLTALLAERDPLRFTQLSADYTLKSGSAYTANLHLDGDVEVLMSGRIGLIARDYDCSARVLRGHERLPPALRKFAGEPRVGAALLALRDYFAEPDAANTQLQLSGSWDAPVLSAAAETH